jgi:ubiquitin-like domain-containing CTD phosphatase 1
MAPPPTLASLPLVHVRYQKLDLTFTPGPDATIRHLRIFLHEQTRVAPARQKLIGLPALTPDSASLSSVKLKARLMLIGTPDEVHDAAASEAAAGLAAASSIADDIDIEEPLSSPVHLLDENLAKVARRVSEYKPVRRHAPRPNSRLLVLDVDYTLFDHRSPAENAAALGRPFLHDFLTAAHAQHFDIIIWSATSMRWIELKMQELNLAADPGFRLYMYYDAGAMITLHAEKYGTLNVKPLGVIWGQNPQWGPHNTVMFDDLSRNFLMNPQSGLKIRPCRHMTVEANRLADRELLRLGRYLRLLASMEDFRGLDHRQWEAFVKARRDELPKGSRNSFE